MKDGGIKVSISPVRIDNGRKQVGYWNSDDFRSDENCYMCCCFSSLSRFASFLNDAIGGKSYANTCIMRKLRH